MREENLKKANLFNHYIQAGLFSSIFAFTSNIGGIRIIFERSLSSILLPIAITPDAIGSLLALVGLANAENKNLGKVFDLIFTLIKTALVFTAVFAGFSPIVVHGLFLAAVGSGMAYHISLCFYNLYYWLKTPKNFPAELKLKNLYKENVIKNGVSAFKGSIVIAGILTTMVFAPYLGATILAATGIGIGIILTLSSTYELYRYFKQPTPLHKTNNDSIFHTNKSAPLQQNNSKGYYYRKFRSEQLTGNLKTDKDFLIKEIHNKKEELKHKTDQCKGKISEFFWPENPKRCIKHEFLENLASQLRHFPEAHSASLSDNATIDPSFFSSPPKKAVQSFFRAEGDVNDIIQATKKHVENYRALAEANQSNYSPVSPYSSYGG